MDKLLELAKTKCMSPLIIRKKLKHFSGDGGVGTFGQNVPSHQNEQ